jgi:hypothetical protein
VKREFSQNLRPSALTSAELFCLFPNQRRACRATALYGIDRVAILAQR